MGWGGVGWDGVRGMRWDEMGDGRGGKGMELGGVGWDGVGWVG